MAHTVVLAVVAVAVAADVAVEVVVSCRGCYIIIDWGACGSTGGAFGAQIYQVHVVPG